MANSKKRFRALILIIIVPVQLADWLAYFPVGRLQVTWLVSVFRIVMFSKA